MLQHSFGPEHPSRPVGISEVHIPCFPTGKMSGAKPTGCCGIPTQCAPPPNALAGSRIDGEPRAVLLVGLGNPASIGRDLLLLVQFAQHHRNVALDSPSSVSHSDARCTSPCLNKGSFQKGPWERCDRSPWTAGSSAAKYRRGKAQPIRLCMSSIIRRILSEVEVHGVCLYFHCHRQGKPVRVLLVLWTTALLAACQATQAGHGR